jgi:O-antigen/teichoic acid export membrane protein
MLIINLVALLLTPFILKYLTKEEFALFYIAGDLLMWLGLAQLGVSSSYNSRASQLFGQKNEEELKYLTSSAWGLQIASSLVILIGGVILSFFVNSFFKVQNNSPQTQTFFLILVVASAAQVFSQVFSALLISAKLININNRISIISVVPKVVFTLLFLLAGWKLVGLALANMIASITPIIISIYYVRRKFPQIPIRLKYWTRKHTGELLMNGIWFTLGGLAGILILGLDRIVIAKVVSLEVVASFLITQKLYFLSDKVFAQIFNTARPFMGQLYGAGSYKKLLSLYNFFLRLSILLAVAGGSAIFIINEEFVRLWVGKEFYLGDKVSLFLAVNFIVQFILLPNRVLLATSMYKLNWQAYARIIEGLANLGLSIILGRQLGVVGVVIGSIIPSIVFSNLLYIYYIWSFFRSFSVKNDARIFLNYFLIGTLFLLYIIDISLPVLVSIISSIIVLTLFCHLYLKFFMRKAWSEGIFSVIPLPRIIRRIYLASI